MRKLFLKCNFGGMIKTKKGGADMVETFINAIEILEKHGLEAQEIEPSVYEVSNTGKTVSIDDLQHDLDCCVLITSADLKYERLVTGINSVMSCVYYVILNYDNKSIGRKYNSLAEKKFGETLIMPYKNKHISYGSIDTIYAKGEI